MHARVGDRIVITRHELDRPVRAGEILEVRAPDGGPPYRVRWADGQEALVYPGPDAHIEHVATDVADVEATAGLPQPRPGAAGHGHVRTWRVELYLFEDGTDTAAQAVLRTDGPAPIEATGHARRTPSDPDVPAIGDEVAAARALRALAERLLGTASADLTDMEGRPVVLTQ